MKNEICCSCGKEIAAKDVVWLGGDPFGLTQDGEGNGEDNAYCAECVASLKQVQSAQRDI